MCEPISIIAGVASAAGGMMQAQAQHNAQQAAVNRSNAIAQQQYQDQLRRSEEQDRIKKEKHTADAQAHAQALNDFNKQLELNQLEANRAMTIVNRKKKEKQAEAAFELENQISKSIQAQGQLLSSGGTGQSFLLQTLESERALGMQGAMIEQ